MGPDGQHTPKRGACAPSGARRRVSFVAALALVLAPLAPALAVQPPKIIEIAPERTPPPAKAAPAAKPATPTAAPAAPAKPAAQGAPAVPAKPAAPGAPKRSVNPGAPADSAPAVPAAPGADTVAPAPGAPQAAPAPGASQAAPATPSGAAAAFAKPSPRVRLVLQIVVDQLRGNFADHSRHLWARGGFRRLFDEGSVFTDAHHAHANTETIVGHATLATGADPSVHGMVGNAWYDRSEGHLRYNIEDARYDIVGDDGVASGGNGHPGVTKKARGRSPEAMLAPAIADSFAEAGGGAAKVFAVSLKDRAAVPMAGRRGKALWWSDATGEFISSAYYYPDRHLPAWVAEWNSRHVADRFDGSTWDLLLAPQHYRARKRDNMPWEEPPAGMGSTFPHRFDRGALGAGFYSAVAASPFGDDILLDFTRTLIRAEQIGLDDVIDYVSVSFSAQDYVGHRYGPSSLEYEDSLLRADRTLAALLAYVDETIGKGRTLVVLSSDHGVAEPPEALVAEGKSAGRISLSEVEKSEAVSALTQKFGGRLVRNRWPPYVYVDSDALQRHNIDPDGAARELAVEIAKAPGVEAAFPRSQIVGGELPKTEAARAVRRSFHATRSGDIHVVPKKGWQLAYEGETSSRYATGHGTPWSYDSHVPLVIAGPGLARTTVKRRVETVDIAPTIAAIAGVPKPALSTGKVLPEPLQWRFDIDIDDEDEDD